MTQLLKRMMLTMAALLVGSASALVPLNQALAVSGSEWRAGRIADDATFTNANAMSVSEIQAFLNARVPSCDTWGTQASEFGGGTRAQYGAANGNPAPFTCLKDYHEVPKTTPGPVEPASNYGGAAIPPGAQSAAQLIANASAKYSINPRVLLVKLATESAGPLTSDDWPFKRQYLYAMGAHCPDSGPGGAANCDANWAGFSLQMDEAAALLRWYLDSMTQSWWQYKKPYQTNHILWRVTESGCGGGDVYIQSKATAALYTYTPYQPNQAALNNLYGTGDGCSSYGNRNFWRVWHDWFGNPAAPPITVTESPTSVSWANGRIDVFARGSDGGLWQKWYDVNAGETWQPWANLGGAIHSAPTVSTMGPGRLDIFTKGAGGDLMHYWYGAGAWQNWESLGQPSPNVYLISSPAAVSWANGRIDVFARGSDGGLWQKWYDVNHGGWNSWARIGTGLTSAPSVSSWKSERLDVFGRGPNGEVLHYWFMKPQGWGSESIGGNVISNPASASWAEGRLDVFVQGRDGYMYQNWYDASQGGGWRGWHKFGFGLSSNPSVSSWAPGRLDLFTKGTSSDLQHFWFTNLSWSSHWESLGQPY